MIKKILMAFFLSFSATSKGILPNYCINNSVVGDLWKSQTHEKESAVSPSKSTAVKLGTSFSLWERTFKIQLRQALLSELVGKKYQSLKGSEDLPFVLFSLLQHKGSNQSSFGFKMGLTLLQKILRGKEEISDAELQTVLSPKVLHLYLSYESGKGEDVSQVGANLCYFMSRDLGVTKAARRAMDYTFSYLSSWVKKPL